MHQPNNQRGQRKKGKGFLAKSWNKKKILKISSRKKKLKQKKETCKRQWESESESRNTSKSERTGHLLILLLLLLLPTAPKPSHMVSEAGPVNSQSLQHPEAH